MKAALILVLVIVVLLIIKACTTTDSAANDTSRPSADTKPTQLNNNDKIIVVDKISHEQIKKALKMFCNMYNKSDYAVQPRLYSISETKFAVTFPFDVDFQTFCFAVNYLKYPLNVNPLPDVRAWTTTKHNDEWITEKSADKPVMLFLAADDKEYDNVFLTTQDNIGYKLGFSMGQEKQLLISPKEKYITHPVTFDSLKDLKFEDFD